MSTSLEALSNGHGRDRVCEISLALKTVEHVRQSIADRTGDGTRTMCGPATTASRASLRSRKAASPISPVGEIPMSSSNTGDRRLGGAREPKRISDKLRRRHVPHGRYGLQ
jgi:hypothetical protein